MTIPCYLFDIDGTLSNAEHRLHFIKPTIAAGDDIPHKPDWDAYFMACDKDTPHKHICALARVLSVHHRIIYVSGRSDICRALTIDWLRRQNLPISIRSGIGDNLYMRPQGDHKNDDQLKIELLAQIRADGYEPIMAFDDRNRVVKAWRDAGIPCAQVAEGDF